MKKGLRVTIISLSAAIGISLSTAVGVTYANYKVLDHVGQTVGYQGQLNQTSIFLNANIWEVSNALFYMYDDDRNVWHAPAKTITPVIGGTTFVLYVYVLPGQIDSHSNIVFARVNPNGRSIPVDGEDTEWDFGAGDQKTIWNQTDNITHDQLYDNSKYYNYFCVDGWTSGVNSHNNNTEKNSGYTKNSLKVSNGALVFY